MTNHGQGPRVDLGSTSTTQHGDYNMATSYMIFIRLYVQSLCLDLSFGFGSVRKSQHATQNYVGCGQYPPNVYDIHMPCETSENVLIPYHDMLH